MQGRGGKGVLTRKITSTPWRTGRGARGHVRRTSCLAITVQRWCHPDSAVKPVRDAGSEHNGGQADGPAGRCDPRGDRPQCRRAGRTGLVDDGDTGEVGTTGQRPGRDRAHPKDALDALRDVDQASDLDASGHSSGPSRPAPAGPPTAGRRRTAPARASAAAGRTAARPRRSARTAASPGSGRPTGPERRPRACRPARAPAGLGGGHGAGPGANGTHGSITGYRRSDYAPPTAYPGSYGVRPARRSATRRPRSPAGRGARRGCGRTALGAATRAGRPAVAVERRRPARRARLQLKRIDPWSVMKFSFVLAVALFFVVARRDVGALLACWTRWASSSRSTALYDDGHPATASDSAVLDHRPGCIGTRCSSAWSTSCCSPRWPRSARSSTTSAADLVGGIELTLAEKD